MSIEKEINVPEFLRPVFEEILNGIPFHLFEQKAFYWEQLNGFRIIPKNLPLIKKAILAAIFSPNPMPKSMRSLLQNNMPLIPLIDCFQPDCLFLNLNAYFRIFGRNRVLATMLFSNLDEVRDKAREILDQPLDKFPDQIHDPAERIEELKTVFAPIFDFLQEFETETLPDSEPEEQTDDMPEESVQGLLSAATVLEAVTALEERLCDAQTAANRQNREIKKLREKLDATLSENKDQAARVQTLSLQNETLRQQLEKAQQERDEQKRLCEQTQTLALRREAALQNTNADLINQIKLQKQKHPDAASENTRCTALRNQRDGYRKAYGDLRDALRDFVARMPVYEPEEATPPNLEDASPAEPPQTQIVSDADSFENLLSSADFAEHLSNDDQKLSRLVRLTNLSLSPDSRLSILIDGHNVLNCAKPYGKRQDSFSHEELRDHFADDLQSLRRMLPNSEITLYWDGPNAVDSNRGSIKIVYSGGIGDHRADHRIENYLSYLRKGNPDLPILIVTGDYGMRERCSADNPLFLAPAQFLSILEIH
ncbi:MAG: NYN domain-containing protein [Kiritimatiellia bacterium]